MSRLVSCFFLGAAFGVGGGASVAAAISRFGTTLALGFSTGRRSPISSTSGFGLSCCAAFWTPLVSELLSESEMMLTAMDWVGVIGSRAGAKLTTAAIRTAA